MSRKKDDQSVGSPGLLMVENVVIVLLLLGALGTLGYFGIGYAIDTIGAIAQSGQIVSQ